MSNFYKLFFVVFFIFIKGEELILAQDNKGLQSKIVVYYNNKACYEHLVEKGQTLYSISKKYDTEISLIENFNDGLKDGLKLGSIIYIPIKFGQILHKVEKGQTLYSIAKLYNIEKAQIIKDNSLADENLKLEQSLIIKFNSIPSKETPKKDIITAIDANPTQLESIKSEIVKQKNEEPISSDKLIVALLIPLFLEKNFPIEEGASEEIAEEKLIPVFPKSISALEFYEGVKLACENKESNKQIEIIVIDCPNDTAGVKAALQNKDLKRANVVIGSFNSNYAPFVADYCKKNKKIYCTPFGQQGKILLNNESAFKASASNTTQLESVADYLKSNFNNSQCVVVHNGLKKEKNLVDAFKLKYNSLAGDTAREVLFKDVKLAGLKLKLSNLKINNIVVTSNDQAFVTDFINKISTIKEDYKINIFGTDQWQEYENLEVEKLQELNLHIPSNYYIDYSDSLTKEFIQKFRTEYYAEPTRTGFLGYDLMSMLITNSQQLVNIDSICTKKYKGLHIVFDFTKTSHESGYENRYTSILKYEDLLLKAVEK